MKHNPDATKDMAAVEFYEERAAIMEYDGSLPREEAERRPWKETVDRVQKIKASQHTKSLFAG